MPGAVVCEVMEDSRCHENVARLWTDKRWGLVAIGTGYALSEDGLWRRHSWVGYEPGSTRINAKEGLGAAPSDAYWNGCRIRT
jgi:hypothetical protein